MRIIIMYILSLLLIILFVVSCDLNTNPTGSVGVSGYPRIEGSEWVYEIDGLKSIKYTIEGTYKHPEAGDTQILKTYSFNGSVWTQTDENYMEANADAVRLYVNSDDDFFYRLLEFPLTVRSEWVFMPGIGALVTAKETISVPAGDFEAYRIEYSGTGDFTVWYVPEIGGWGIQNYAWWSVGDDPATLKLVEYTFPE